MMSKKKIMYGIYGVLFGVFILIGTYAWLTWKSNETALVLTIGNINNIQITLKPYVIDDELLPVLSYESGVSTNVDVVNNSSVKKKFKLYYKINDIAEELIDEAFKYTITRSVDSGNTYEIYKEGNFVGTTSNSNLEILEETIVKNDNYKYKVYLWLDGDGNSQGNVQGKGFSGELRAEFLEDPKDIMIDLPDGMIPITFDTSNNSTVVKTVYSSRIEDLSGNGTISKINGAMYNENGLVFDGVDDSVLLPEYSLSSMSNGFTFEVMIDANSVTTTDTSEEMYLIGNCEVGGSALLIKNGVFRMYVYDETNSKYVIASSSKILVPNKKYLLTGIFDGENIKIYINGKLVTTTVFSGTMKDTSSSTHFFLGCNPKGTDCQNSYYNGIMYEARMYDRALTDKEVSNNYNGNITNSNLLFSFDFKNGSREEYKNNKGVIIPEDDILAYYVYVPRYEYKIWETGTSATGKEQEIEINLQNKYDNKSNGTQVGEYLTHPAFTFGDTELNGIWVGKFETTGTADSPTIKPNVTSLRNQNVATQFQTSLKFSGGTLSEGNVTFTGNDIYGLNNKTDSHMMKNSEWGAAAYLSHSKYGINKEIRINNYWDSSGNFLTGCGASTADESRSSTCGIVYGNTLEYPQSTTGNILGIFDMSGGANEYVMSVFTNSDGELWSGASTTRNSGFTGLVGTSGDLYTGINFPNNKYYDIYKSSSGTSISILTACNGNICYGHSLSETYNWYKDNINFICADYPWLPRSGYADRDASAGIFSTNFIDGGTYSYVGFRSVITSN